MSDADADFKVELPSGQRSLTEIIFPDGAKRGVRYMRDGIILFADEGPSATYERNGDGTVTIRVLVNRDEAFAAAIAYQAKVLPRIGRRE